MNTNLDKFFIVREDAQPVPNRAALIHANDTEYFSVLPDAPHRVRPWGRGDPSPVLSAPSGMKTYTIITAEGVALALYFVDSRVTIGPGVDANEVFLLPPASWSEQTKRNAGVMGQPGVRASILAPLFPSN